MGIPTIYRTPDGSFAAGDVALAEGSVLIGNSSGVASALDGKTSNQVLVGNGTTMTSTTLARAGLTEEALVVYPINFQDLRAADLAALAVSEPSSTDGDHYLVLSSNSVVIRGISPNSTTETDISYFQFRLPAEYVAGGDIKVRVNCKYTAAPDTVGTVDVSVYKVTQTTGAVGSDLVATAAQNLAASGTATDFVVTATGLVAGDLLNVKITTAFQDQNGTSGEAEIGSIAMLLDIKG